MVAICVRRANLSRIVHVVADVRYVTSARSSLSNCSPPSCSWNKFVVGLWFLTVGVSSLFPLESRFRVSEYSCSRISREKGLK